MQLFCRFFQAKIVDFHSGKSSMFYTEILISFNLYNFMQNSNISLKTLQVNLVLNPGTSSGARQTDPIQSFSSFISSLSDKELYRKCQYYGTAARAWRQKFIGLLPEVNRRRLYENKGFDTIFEFAFKLCGLSDKQVRLALNLRERVEDKPALKKMLENGEVSMNKLARVVSIATPENEEELAEKVKVLPKARWKLWCGMKNV